MILLAIIVPQAVMIVIEELFELEILLAFAAREIGDKSLKLLEHLVLRIVVQHDLVHVEAGVDTAAVKENLVVLASYVQSVFKTTI